MLKNLNGAALKKFWWKGENVKKPKRRGPKKIKETPGFNESDYNL